MKNTCPASGYPTPPARENQTSAHGTTLKQLASSFIALSICGIALQSTFAQTVVINPLTRNYWSGINTGATTNSVAQGTNRVALSGGATNVSFVLSGPSFLASPTITPATPLTGSGGLGTRFSVAGPAAAGLYSVTITGTTNDGVSITNTIASTNVNLFVVPQWAQTNIGTTGDWSDSTKWSGGAVPLSTDSVYIDHSIVGPYTNVVDSSRTIQSLVILGDADDNGAAASVNMTIAPGATLSVLGTNGMTIGRKSNTGARPYYMIAGESLVVSNTAADFSILDASGNSTRFLTVNMTNLNTFTANVRRFGVADTSLLANGSDGSQRVGFLLARTNLIKTTFADDYNALDFNTAIQYNRQDQAGNNAGAPTECFFLGATNAFFADSIGVGRGGAAGSGSGAFSIFGYQMKFTVANSNSAAPIATAYFRGTNGGRMSLLAIGVDSGTNSLGNNRGVVDLRGGNVDMLVDQVWIARNRTNTAANDALGGLYFDNGTVDANTLRAGYMQFTNGATSVAGYILVGTNGTLKANNLIELGHTPPDVTGFVPFANAASGQIQINNGGTIRANQINLGLFSTNNVITIGSGGLLDITNTIGTSTQRLTTLTCNGGSLALHVNGTNTPIFASNLIASASSPINVSSVANIGSFPFTFSAISYNSATTPNNWAGGIGPAGITVTVANNAGNNSIDVTLVLGAPKSLVWKGYVDSNWNTTTKNWLDTSTGLHTNFAIGDSVTFDDTASFSSINVAENMAVRQTGTGVLVTNDSLAYTFSGSGQLNGGSAWVKTGSNSLTVNVYTEGAISVSTGSLAVAASGTIGSASIAAGAKFSNAGTVLAAVQCAGVANNSGMIKGALAVQASGIVTNLSAGTVNGALSTGDGSFLYNAGTFTGIGSSATIVSNATFVNAGTIANGGNSAGSLFVNGTFKDLGLDAGTVLNLAALTINGRGTFIPGGDAIGTTEVLTDGVGTDGRLVFLTGSTNIFKVDLGNSQNSTRVKSAYLSLGPNQANPVQNGGTILMTNIGATPYAAGNVFQLAQNHFNGAPFDNGLNTTNSLPVMNPGAPAYGLAWDLSQTIHFGSVKIVGVATAPTNTLASFNVIYNLVLTNAAATNSFTTNNYVITDLNWPSNYVGWSLQQQISPLTNGLSTNWTTIYGSWWTNVMSVTNTLTTNSVFYRMAYP